MTRLEALKELAGKVEAGRVTSVHDTAELLDIGGVRHAYSTHAPNAVKAFNGSLDAAKALHEAVLPEWKPVIDMVCGEIGMHIQLWDDDGAPVDEWMWQFEVRFTDNPARAWLLAIIRALIAQEAAE